jgi:hypothetical protein
MKESMTERPFFLDKSEESTDDIVFGVEVDKMTFRSFSALLSIVTSSYQHLGPDSGRDVESESSKDDLFDDIFTTSCLQLLKQNLERFQRKMRQIDVMNNSGEFEKLNGDLDLSPSLPQSLKISNATSTNSTRGIDLSSEESSDALDYVDLGHSGEEKDSDSGSEGSEQALDPLMVTAASDVTISSASSQPRSPHQRRSYNNNNVLGSPMDGSKLKEDFSSVLVS